MKNEGGKMGKVLLGQWSELGKCWTFESCRCLQFISSFLTDTWHVLRIWKVSTSRYRKHLWKTTSSSTSGRTQLTFVLLSCLFNHLMCYKVKQWSPLRWYIVEWWTSLWVSYGDRTGWGQCDWTISRLTPLSGGQHIWIEVGGAM